MEAPAQADSVAVMQVIRPLLLSPQSDQLAQDIATAIEAVCQMAKADRKRQQALQDEVAKQSAKAAAAERACAELHARVTQLQDALETNQADRDKLQWLEREVALQTQRADAALQRAEAAEQDRVVLEDRLKLLEVTTQQQSSQRDEECAALAHKWQQERARLQRKVEHWNFEVLAQQREINRLRQQVQQQQQHQQQQQLAAGSMRGSDSMGPIAAARCESFANIQPPASTFKADQQQQRWQQQQPWHCSGSLPDSEISLGVHARDSAVLTGQQYNGHGLPAGSRGHFTPETAGGYQLCTPERPQHQYQQQQQQQQQQQPQQQPQQQQQQQQPQQQQQQSLQQFSQVRQQVTPHFAAARPVQYSAQQPPSAAAAAAVEAPVAAAVRTAAPLSPPPLQAAAESRQRPLSERGLPVNRDSILAKHQDELQAFLSAAAAAGGPNIGSWIARELGDSLSTTTPTTSRPSRRPTVQTPPTPRPNDSRLSDDNYLTNSSMYSSPQYMQGAPAAAATVAAHHDRTSRQEAYQQMPDVGQQEQQHQYNAAVGMTWHERSAAADSRFHLPQQSAAYAARQQYPGSSRRGTDTPSSWQAQQHYYSEQRQPQQYEEHGSSCGGGRMQWHERWGPLNGSAYGPPGSLEATYPPTGTAPPTGYHNAGSSGNHSSGYAKVPELNLGTARNGEPGLYQSTQQKGALYTC